MDWTRTVSWKNNLPNIENEESPKDLFPKCIIMVVFNKQKNVKGLFVSWKLCSIKRDLLNKSNHDYKKKNNNKMCDSCQKFVYKTSIISSHALSRNFKSKSNTICRISIFVYVA